MQATTKSSSAVKILQIVFALIVCAVAVLPLGVAAGSKPSETKGRYYFRQTCKSCHTKGAVGGEITPLTKIQAQWKLYFVKGKHNRATEPLAKVMSDEQLQDVAAYLNAHAADSPQPETCGK